ncbi:phosphoinositide 5-phosphatase [Ranunculus cassubicifolius]
MMIQEKVKAVQEERRTSGDPTDVDISSDIRKGKILIFLFNLLACTFMDYVPNLRRRRNSETLRAQYINNKDLRLQKIVPLNAGNIFGAEDRRPVPKWENIIRETLNKHQPVNEYKSYSDPPSPSRFKPMDDFPDVEDETESDSGDEENIYPVNDEDENENYDDLLPIGDNEHTCSEASVYAENVTFDASKERNLQRQLSSPRMLNRLVCLRLEDSLEKPDSPPVQLKRKLTKQLSVSEKIGLSWPEPPLNFAAQHILEKRNSFKSGKSFRGVRSFKENNSFKLSSLENNDRPDAASLINEIHLESLIARKRRPHYVRIISKQMVGVFLSVWVRRSLRKHIHNLKVSTVGVGVMGYIGNKGSISVSMSIYQTLFCFICTHLSSGEKDGDEVRRNTNVQEILRRTQFRSISGIGFPKNIHDHERIIWFGDLNYRINLSYEKTRELISKKEWSKLAEKDQLVRELKKGRAFDGWTEGDLNFPPTYKYEINSHKYYGEDPKVGRRIPACPLDHQQILALYPSQNHAPFDPLERPHHGFDEPSLQWGRRACSPTFPPHTRETHTAKL